MQKSVKKRYSAASQQQEAALCCPVDYRPEYLEIIPQEVIDRDYGCGDPSRYIREGDTVLDLGSGGGKICFIAAQIVGKDGKVIGVDGNPDMLDLARQAQKEVEKKMGYKNLEFRYGHIQNLQLDLDELEKYLKKHPVKDTAGLEALENEKMRLRKELTLIPDASVDVIVSNCVLNLVSDDLKRQLFREMFRVLKRGGRIAVSDIVSDEVSPEHLKKDDKLWSGCISGAFQEAEFLHLLEEVGFYGMTVDKYEQKPWQIVEGIEYRSVTVTASKGKQGPCIEKNHAVIYKGPWKEVHDDDDHVYYRGERMAVCEKTFGLMTSEPYVDHLIPVPPQMEVKEERIFDCSRPLKRSPKETKEGVAPITSDPAQMCPPTGRAGDSSSGCC